MDQQQQTTVLRVLEQILAQISAENARFAQVHEDLIKVNRALAEILAQLKPQLAGVAVKFGAPHHK